MKMEVGVIPAAPTSSSVSTPPSSALVIMGHENIGIIAKAGANSPAARGSRKAIWSSSSTMSLRQCEWQHAGQYRHCREHQLADQSRRHPLWLAPPRPRRCIYGAASRNMSICRGMPWCIMCPCVGVSAELAGLVTPMANGVGWSLFRGRRRLQFDRADPGASASRACRRP